MINCMAFSMVMSTPTVINRCTWSGMITKSWSRNLPAATYERNASIISVALRSDCNNGRPWLVFVVAKNVRAELTILSGWALRVGLAITRG